MEAKYTRGSNETQKIMMLLGSMDHSPSEQLVGDPDCWHHTVSIFSEGGEHWELAGEIAQRVKGSSNLSKWAGRKGRYKREFEAALADSIGKYPVFLTAISAQEGIIEASVDHMIYELGLSGHVQTFEKNDKPYVTFGPFLKGKYGIDRENFSEVSFELPRNQALPLIFICHFVLRTHQKLLASLRVTRSELKWLDLQLMPNKFPGGIDGRMASLFDAIVSLTSPEHIAGNVRIVTFLESKGDAGNELADNIAGLLRDKTESGDRVFLNVAEAVHWEIWEPSSGIRD